MIETAANKITEWAQGFVLDGALTTALILGWLAVFTLVATLVGIFIHGQNGRNPDDKPVRRVKSESSAIPFIVPSLALAPLAIFSAWAAARINLIFPVFEFSGLSDIAIASIAPALLLFIGSGLLGRIITLSRSEWSFWSEKPFVRVDRAFGKNIRSRLAPMVASRILLQSTSDCLPMVFSELIIIESIFNAPGLGFWSWEYAKTRDVESATKSIAVLFFIYGLINLTIYFANKNLGKKLTGYV